MDLSDIVESDDTKMSEIPDTNHRGNNGRKKPRKKTPEWNDSESEDDDDEEDDGSKNSDEDEEDDDNGEANIPTTSNLENSEDTAMETTGNDASTNCKNSDDADMGNTGNDAKNLPNFQNSPTHINHAFVEHDRFKQEWNCVRLEMQFNAVNDEQYKSLLNSSVTNNEIDDQKIAYHPVITSIGKIIQECKSRDNYIDFKTSLTGTLIDGGMLSRSWSNNDIKEHFNYSIVTRDRSPDQRNLKVVLMMYYGQL